MINKNIKKILAEIDFVLEQVKQAEVDKLIKIINKSKRIIVCGAGRVGLSTRAFASRLSHMGFNAYMVGDSNLPRIGSGDLLLVSSGSGETQTIVDLARIAKKNGSKLALVTGNRQSRIGRIADSIVVIKAPSKVKQVKGFKTIQPMTTLNEQCLWIFYDALVLSLMKEHKQTNMMMNKRHSILE